MKYSQGQTNPILISKLEGHDIKERFFVEQVSKCVVLLKYWGLVTFKWWIRTQT